MAWTDAYNTLYIKKKIFKTFIPDHVVQLVVPCSGRQKVAGSIRVRAHAWVLGLVPSWMRGNWSMFLSHINVSPPPEPLAFPPSKNK